MANTDISICKRCFEAAPIIGGGICGSCADDLRADAQAAEAEQQFEAMQEQAR